MTLKQQPIASKGILPVIPAIKQVSMQTLYELTNKDCTGLSNIKNKNCCNKLLYSNKIRFKSYGASCHY